MILKLIKEIIKECLRTKCDNCKRRTVEPIRDEAMTGTGTMYAFVCLNCSHRHE